MWKIGYQGLKTKWRNSERHRMTTQTTVHSKATCHNEGERKPSRDKNKLKEFMTNKQLE